MKKLLMAMLLGPLMALADTWTDPSTGITWTYSVSTYSVSDGQATVEGADPETGAITIPSTLGGHPVTSIAEGAFSNCSGLTSVTIPSSVTSIGEWAFACCSGLTSVTIPSSVTSIGEDAFEDTKLWNDHPDGLVIVGDCLVAYKGDCSGKVEIPKGVRVIADYVFSSCDITEVVMPEGLTSIGDSAFLRCRSLKTFNLPETVSAIGFHAFENCDIDGEGILIVDGCVLGVKGDCPTNVVIPDGVHLIANGALEDGRIKTLKLPKSLRSVGVWAFTDIEADVLEIEDLRTWCNVDFAISPHEDTPWWSFATIKVGGQEVRDLVIPTEVTEIKPRAFFGWAGIDSVAIHPGVTSIGAEAFLGCEGLTSVTIPSSVTSIGEQAFGGCYGLVSVTIPEGVTSIGYGTFEGCSGLTSVTIPSSVTSIGAEAFLGCEGLTSVTIPSSVTSIGDHAFYGCDGILSVTIPEGVTSIAYGVFGSCYGLTSVTIPSSVTRIGEDAFFGCSGLMSVTIPPSVTSIGEGAFIWCSGLTSVTIPPSVTSIGHAAFRGCDGLKTIHVGNDGDIDVVKQMLRESGFDVDGVAFDYVEIPIPNYCTVMFDANGGLAERATATVARYSAIGTLPTATRERYEFLGWFTAAVGGTQVTAATKVTGNVTFYAQWQKIGGEEDPASPPVEPPDEPVGPTTPTNAPPTVVDEAETHVDVEKGEVAPFETAAMVYDGFLYEGEKVIGSVQVKVAKGKIDKKIGVFSAKVTATVQLAGEAKKLNFKGGIADEKGAVTRMSVARHELDITVGVNGLGGMFRRAGDVAPYQVSGARNVFSGKSTADKSAASDAARLYQGVYNVAFDGGTLSISVDKKGKAKIVGTGEGNKVSATSQLVVGKDGAVVPVVIVKKVNLSFCLWVMAGGTVEVRGIEDAIVGKAGALNSDAKFGVDMAAAAKGLAALPRRYDEYLPNGIDVAVNGTKWVVAGGAKAGKVAFVKGGNTIDESKLGANPSGLKLAYKQKDGTFKGSFKVYNLENGKIKAYTASVTGVMIGAKGYGTATIKKVGSVPVVIE